jgi:hypothetical protein
VKLVHKRALIANVAANWKAQYYTKNGWSVGGLEKEGIYNRLRTLPPNATEEQVTAIIGNQSWTRNACDQCKRDTEVVVEVGQAPDYDSATARLCVQCLQSALELISADVVI